MIGNTASRSPDRHRSQRVTSVEDYLGDAQLPVSIGTLHIKPVGRNANQIYFSALATGFLSGMTESWLLCGGECSFIGFNSQGEEVYWNVASDTISYVCKLISQFIGKDDSHFRWFKRIFIELDFQ